jgi:hypothetical protein
VGNPTLQTKTEENHGPPSDVASLGAPTLEARSSPSQTEWTHVVEHRRTRAQCPVRPERRLRHPDQTAIYAQAWTRHPIERTLSRNGPSTPSTR